MIPKDPCAYVHGSGIVAHNSGVSNSTLPPPNHLGESVHPSFVPSPLAVTSLVPSRGYPRLPYFLYLAF